MRKLDCPKLVKTSVILSIFFLVFFPSAAFALSSDTINFQGKIVRNDTGYEGLNVTAGSPACVVAGNSNDTCDFQVRYYSASTGGTLLLTEAYANVEIGQYNGAFNLSLGSDGSPTAGSYASFDAMVKGVTDLYVQLGFSPAGNATYSETFSRMPIQASAYALKAKYASGANTAFRFDNAANSSGYTSPAAGMVYYDTTDGALKVYNGSTWGELGGGGTGSLFTDGGLFTYLTSLTDHFVLGSNSYTAIGTDSYATYLTGLSSRSTFSLDMDAERLTLSGSHSQSGLTVYSDYSSTNAWPVATFKAEDSGFDNVVMQITQDGTGNILSLQKGSTDAFVFENPLTFYIHPRVDDPSVTSNRLYNVNGTLYWNGSPISIGGGLWTDAGTFSYLTSTTDDLILGGNSAGTAKFFFDVSTGNLGIGTSTPGSKLEIAGASSVISNSTGDLTISPDETLVIKANDTDAENLTEWQNSVGTVLGLINQNGYATFGKSTSTGAILTLGASTNTVAQMNLATGVDVAAPTTGDMWWNGTNLYFYDGSNSIDLLSGGVNVLSNYGMVSDGTFINLAHNTNTYNVSATGWVCEGGSNNEACSGGAWRNLEDTNFTETQSTSEQWNAADADGIIRTVINDTSIALAPGGTTSVATASGGSIVYADGYAIHTFTSSGTFYPSGVLDVDVLIVAGGGGGGSDGGGGGGAGGLIYASGVTAPGGSNPIVVGNGGASNTNGSNSTALGYTAVGGGHGGIYYNGAGTNGGSGGGGGANTGAGGTGTSGQGHNGLGGQDTFAGGGGGGAGEDGKPNGGNGYGGDGGNGLQYDISGESVYYAGGGGGGGQIRGDGGLGGGGNGAIRDGSAGSNGVANTGGGGGGSGNGTTGGTGGSGVVIIRYKYASTYGIYNSPVISTPNAQSYSNLKWDATLNSYIDFDDSVKYYDKISVQTRSGNTPDPTAPANDFVWTKYNNIWPERSNTTGTDGRIPAGTFLSSGDWAELFGVSVIKDGSMYKMWYGGQGHAGGSDYLSGIFYATSPDGISWTKYDNALAARSDTTGTNGRVPVGSVGRGDSVSAADASIIKEGSVYKMWYSGRDDSWDERIFYATSPDGITWTKYDNTIPTNSDTTSTNGRIPWGTAGKGDCYGASSPTVIYADGIYKMWYSGHSSDGTRIFYATSPDGLTWTKYDNTIPSDSDSIGTNGRIPQGILGYDDSNVEYPDVILDNGTYKMWYSNGAGLFYATSADGLTWTKYDSTYPFRSDTTTTHGRLAEGNNGRGDAERLNDSVVIKEGDTFKMWYVGYGNGDIGGVYHATGKETIGSWEAWKPYNLDTNYTTLESADIHTNWVGNNATVSEGDVTRNVDYFEDEDEPLGANVTKITSSNNGGYARVTLSDTKYVTSYDYITFWVRSSQRGDVLRMMVKQGEWGWENNKDIIIDEADVWQKVYWDLSDLVNDGVSVITLYNLTSISNTIYIDNIRAEKLLSDGSEDNAVASTPNEYFQYRVIFTTTNTDYQPALERISFSYNSGYRTVMYDTNNVRLYNYSGASKYLRLEVVARSGGDGGGGGSGFVNGLAVSNVADGEDAIAFQFNTTSTFANSSSKLLSVMNNSVEKMYLDANGNLYVSGAVIAGKGMGSALVNQSGTTWAERSLVTIDSSTNNAFTTTTIAGLQGALGVVQGVATNGDVNNNGSCDNGDTCIVVFEGVVNVNLDNAASSSRGDYIYSSTTAGQGHSAPSTTQTNGLVGMITSIENASYGYVQMVFDAQNKVTADMYINTNYDEGLYKDMYNQLANDYESMSDAERRGYLESNQSQTIMFDNFVDSLKIDSTNSTIGVDSDAQKAGLWGGVTIDGALLDPAGYRYLSNSSATLLTSKYYDRTQSGLQGQDSTPETMVDLGIDPNWYNGVSLQTTSNLSTSYNGSLIKVSGMYSSAASEHGYIDLTVTGTTVTGITANISASDGNCTATGVTLAFGSDYAFVAGSCSASTITINPVRGDYNNGDRFRIASWYVEPTVTNERGSKREFPERALLLASTDGTSGGLSITDVDTQRVWMRFTKSATGELLGIGLNNTISSISMMNGELSVGMNGSAATGMYTIEFGNDKTYLYNTSGKSVSNRRISDRLYVASTYSLVNTTQSFISNVVNDVSSAAIPNQPTQNVTVSGWGYRQGYGNPSVEEMVTLPYEFDSIPTITTGSAGYKDTTAPTSLSDCAAASVYQSTGGSVTNISFVANVLNVDAAVIASTRYVCYTWTATGQVSPKKFIAVGTNGGVKVINKTKESAINIITSSSPTYDFSRHVLIAGNRLYFTVDGSTLNRNLQFVQNIAGVTTSMVVALSNSYNQYRTIYSLIPAISNDSSYIYGISATIGTSTIDNKSNTIYVSHSSGVSVIQENQSMGNIGDGAEEATGSVRYYTKDYISEEMVGDIRGMWPLNYDNTSADNEDVSMKANALTAVNIDSTDAVSGVRGKAVDFNGTDESLYIPDDSDFDFTSSFTLGAWVKTTDTDGTIFTKYEYNVEEKALKLSGGKALFILYGLSTTYVQSNTSINDGQWHYVVGRYDGTSLNIYIDGELDVTASATGNTGNGAGSMTIGYDYSGVIDEVMVTATIISPAQIKSMYENGLRALKGSHSTADTYNQLGGTVNVASTLFVTPDNKHMYVGMYGGGISKMDLTSSTRLSIYNTGTDPQTPGNFINSMVGRNYPVFAGFTSGNGRLIGIDSNGNNSTGTYYSRTTTFDKSTNRAFLWMNAYMYSGDPDSWIKVSASNDNGVTYVEGVLIKTNTTGELPEYEYSFTFPTSDKNYKVKFEMSRKNTNKSATYITKWGLSQMELDTASVNGLFTDSNGSVANGSYIDVVHGQNTYDLVANGWVFDTALSQWVEITSTGNGITQNLSNQWNDASAEGIIRSTINATNISLSSGNTYGIYNSSVISTPNAQAYDNLRWDSNLGTYGKISVQTRSGNTPDPTNPTDSFTWTKYDNSTPAISDTTGTNGRLAGGTSGKGDENGVFDPTIIKDGETYKMWYSGTDSSYGSRIYYATSLDGVVWTKYDNTIPSDSDTTGSNGRIPLGTSTKGDRTGVGSPSVIKEGGTYKMWYTGYDTGGSRIYYATSSDGLTWTKYDNTVPAVSDGTSSNGRIPLGTSGKGDEKQVSESTVIKDGDTYKMWYSGTDSSWKSRIYYATSPDGLTWTKYDNTIPSNSDTISSNGRIPSGTSGKGDQYSLYNSTVIKDGEMYKMWYASGSIYYATSPDGLTWTKYDNTTPPNSDTISSNGRITFGTVGKGDEYYSRGAVVIKDGETYKAWYTGVASDWDERIYYATGEEIIGSWEDWKPSTTGTDYTTLQSADTHTDWTGTNAIVTEGDVTRNLNYFEDEDEPLGGNTTKVISTTNGGYAESTITSTNLASHDYISLWVRASQTGQVISIGMGESAGTEQSENITIDVAGVWQKVYWNISDIPTTSRDAITKIRITNFSTNVNVIYIDNVKGEKLPSVGGGSIVSSAPNDYFQYRVIFTTTNTSNLPQLENISLTYSSGYKIQIIDANTVRLYNNSGKTQKLKLDVILGSAALDLKASQYSVNIAPSTADIDGGNYTNSIWINKLGVGGNLLRLQTNSTDMMVVTSEGDMTLAGDVEVEGGTLTLGTTGDQGSIRYNATSNRIEFSNDGTTWMTLGDNARKVTLSAEYAGAVLSGDGTDNVGSMLSDNTGSSSNSMNYYEWNNSIVTLNDYDVRVRFTLPSDFNGWDTTGSITLNYATESTSNTDNKLDMYIYREDSATIDGSSENNVSSVAGTWTTSTVMGSNLDECDTAGDVCVIILRMSSRSDNYVRIGDIDITYNRSL